MLTGQREQRVLQKYFASGWMVDFNALGSLVPQEAAKHPASTPMRQIRRVSMSGARQIGICADTFSLLDAAQELGLNVPSMWLRRMRVEEDSTMELSKQFPLPDIEISTPCFFNSA